MKRRWIPLAGAVVVVIGVGWPLLRHMSFKSALQQVMNNGRNIYVSLFAAGLENPLNPASSWPDSTGRIGQPTPRTIPIVNTEEYAHRPENRFRETALSPLSTVSIDVDTASYANVRRFLTQGRLPPSDAVRIEELINYFSYDYPQPLGDHPIAVISEVSTCPWEDTHQLLRIGMQSRPIPMEGLPPANLVFLLDVSGSMNQANKLPLLRESILLLVDRLRPEDQVAIVVYAGAAGLVLPSTPGDQRQEIRDAVDALTAGGSTAGGAGIRLAYEVASSSFRSEGNNRVILATDGDFNVGISSESDLIDLIEEKRKSGIYLTVLGFGTGNYKDAKMESLADHGNGNYAYVDSIREAHKVLVRELGSTLFTVANDVKAQIEFNPEHVHRYRLLGYENRMLNAEDFADDLRDAGEMGAGHSVTFLYELQPSSVDPATRSPELRYRSSVTETGDERQAELAMLHFRYKRPGETESLLLSQPIPAASLPIDRASEDLQFAAAVSAWGMLLGDSSYKADADWGLVEELARDGIGEDPTGDRAEFIHLVRRSRDLAEGVSWSPPAQVVPAPPAVKSVSAFRNSTDFFQHIMASGMMNVGPAFFAAPGSGLSTQPGAILSRKDNIWCIPLGINDATPDGTPVLFTRNLAVTNLAQLKGRVVDTLDDVPPFGKEGLVVIINGGTSHALQGRELNLTWEEILPRRPPPMRILRP